MSKNTFESKQLKQISEINDLLSEGSIASSLMRVLFGGRAKKLFKQAAKDMKDDPELTAAMSDLFYHTNRLKDLQKSFCDRFPDAKRCK